ncbi:unnamed protein product [Bursaphelenchus xylophilus]|uniref:(pine wood nematode) hypothetical protein n=1 Tax=Bursaphelenchus xylophilus TaxID=6326 RepID=A0A1I7RKT3_BURXY|nr:unnamed protein product [Bursaphelenchus xylophilus]CAG9131110.1 unnamed protein product [Bursaphelenchus xylophilus]
MRIDSLSYRVLFKAKRLLGLDPGVHPIVWRKEPQVNYEFPTHLIPKLNEKERRNVLSFQKELEVLSRIYTFLPSAVDDKFWLKIARCDRTKERFDALKFMKTKEKLEEKDERRKKANIERIKEDGERVPGYNNYSETPYLADQSRLQAHSIFTENSRLVRAYQLQDRPAVAVDCRFLQDHSQRGLALTFVQLNYLFGQNRQRKEPWRLDFVNYDDNVPILRECRKRYLLQFESSKKVCGRLTNESYLDLYNKDDVIYLSPHTDNVLSSEEVLDPKKCFVIGGIVDRVKELNIHPEASALVAQQEGVQLRKLPLDLIEWKAGSQFLTFTTVLNILQQTFEANGDFRGALERAIPRRHLSTMKDSKPHIANKYDNLREYERNILRLVTEHTQQAAQEEDPKASRWAWF